MDSTSKARELRRNSTETERVQHKQQRVEDEQRTRWFNSKGYRVLRFWNSEVLTNMAGVLEKIRAELA